MASYKLPGAFTKMAEELALEIRDELGLRPSDRLSPLELLDHLDLPAMPTSALIALAHPGIADAVELLAKDGSLSALTVFRGTERLVVFNDAATAGRQAADITHEAAHGLLLHEPTTAIDEFGCRAWDDRVKAEATHLGACLLIPARGVRYWAKVGKGIDEIAHHFGTSIELARWRYNINGGRRIAASGSRR